MQLLNKAFLYILFSYRASSDIISNTKCNSTSITIDTDLKRLCKSCMVFGFSFKSPNYNWKTLKLFERLTCCLIYSKPNYPNADHLTPATTFFQPVMGVGMSHTSLEIALGLGLVPLLPVNALLAVEYSCPRCQKISDTL